MINKSLLATTVFLLIAKTTFCQLQPAVITGSAEMHQDLMEIRHENYLEYVDSKWGAATYNNELGTRAMNAGKYEEALSYFNKAIAMEMMYPDPYYNRGMIEYRKHNLEAAIDDFEKALSVQPTVDISILDNLAKAQFEYGDYKACVKSLTKLLKFIPGDSQILLRKGIAQNKQKDYKNAKKTLSQSIEVDSTFSSDVYLNKAIAEINLKKSDEALKDLIQARQMGNSGTDSLINVISPGNTITTQPIGDVPKTTTNNQIKTAADLDQNTIADANRYNAKGVQYALANNFTAAISNFNLAISLNPYFAGAYCNRGNAKRVQKNYDGAIADLNKAIALSPKYPVAYIDRGRVEAETRKKDAACMDFNTAKDMGNSGADQFILQYCQ